MATDGEAALAVKARSPYWIFDICCLFFSLVVGGVLACLTSCRMKNSRALIHTLAHRSQRLGTSRATQQESYSVVVGGGGGAIDIVPVNGGVSDSAGEMKKRMRCALGGGGATTGDDKIRAFRDSRAPLMRTVAASENRKLYCQLVGFLADWLAS